MRPVLLVACTLGATLVAASAPLAAQVPLGRAPLDSGTVARLAQTDTTQRVAVRLVAPLGPQSDTVRFCPLAAPGCGPGSVTPVQARATAGLVQVEVRRGSQARDGALVGAVAGGFLSLVVLGAMANSEGDYGTGAKLTAVGFTVGLPTLFGALVGASTARWVPAAP